MRVRAEHRGIQVLEEDYSRIGARFYKEGSRVVRERVRDGGMTARRIAVWTSRRHAKLYPGKITWDRSAEVVYTGAGGTITGQYGPEPSGQGLLAPILEDGSRNNPPHHNLLQSLDIVGPRLHRDAGDLMANLFRPNR